MSIAEITLKLNTASPEQLNAILEILNKKPEPKKRKTNAWVEYLNTYKTEHPDETHKTAMANALKLYKDKPPVVAVKVEKVKKAPKVSKCAVCDYVATCKSNLNRHIKVKHSKERVGLEQAKVRGLLRTNVIRAEKHKDPNERAIAVEKVKQATIMQERINKAIALLIPEAKTAVKKEATTKVIIKKQKQVKLPTKTLLQDINKMYLTDNDIELNITQDNITSITKDEKIPDKYIVETINLNAGDEQIDQLTISSDDMGYDVHFMQKVKMRGGKEVMSIIDSIFIYN
jgi:hypothetical protein